MVPSDTFLGLSVPRPAPEPYDDPGADLRNGVLGLDEAQMGYIKAIQYYNGTVPEFFASLRLRIAMGATGVVFNFNFAKLPVDAVAERLEVAAVYAPDEESVGIVRESWKENRLDLVAPDVMKKACKLGDAYLLVWPSRDGELDAEGNPMQVDIFYQSPRIMRVFYDDENENDKRYAIKRWQDSNSGYTFVNLYYPDRIEKYMLAPLKDSGEKPKWEKRLDASDEGQWPLENPFGEVPVFHFRNEFPYGTPEHTNAFGPQDAIHKLVISHMACVTSDTPVLCSDLTWKPAGELHVGSELVGFDEEASSTEGRKFRPTLVKEFKRGPDECFEIRTSRGVVTCTANHVWPVVWGTQTNVRWVRTDRLMNELNKGRKVQLLWLAEPWDVDDTRDGGWLQGIIDGEGSLTKKVWVDEIVPVGVREVISIETGTETYVAGGFLTHNSVDYNAFPQRYAILNDAYDTSEAAMGDEGDFAFSIDTGATLDQGMDPKSQLTADPASVWFMKGIESYGQFPVGDPQAFLRPFTDYVHAMAVITQTPMHFLDPIVSNVSGESLRVIEAPFAKKVRNRQMSFGATWRDVFRFILKLKGQSNPADVQIHWVPAATVNDLATLQGQAIKDQLGVPPRQLLQEQGYTPEQLDTWGVTIEFRTGKSGQGFSTEADTGEPGTSEEV